MPFSNVWSNTTPADATAANLLGADIRQLRLDIAERMNASFVTDWTTDPLVVQPGIGGSQTGILITIPAACLFSSYQGNDADGTFGGHVGTGNAGLCRIPAGCVLTKMEMVTDISAATSITMTLYKRQFVAAPGAAVGVASIVNNAAGVLLTASGVLAVTIDGGYYYWFGLDGGGGAGNAFTAYGFRFTVTRDSTIHAT